MKQRIDFRAIAQHEENLYGHSSDIKRMLVCTRGILVSLITQYGANLHEDDNRALRCAIAALDYLLIPPSVEVVTTDKPPFELPKKEE